MAHDALPCARGEPGALAGGRGGGGGGDDNKGDADARSRSSAGTRDSKGKEVGRPRQTQRTPPLPTVPIVTPSAQVADWLRLALVAVAGRDGGGEGPAAAGEAAGCTAGSGAGPGGAAEKERDHLRARAKELEAHSPKGRLWR